MGHRAQGEGLAFDGNADISSRVRKEEAEVAGLEAGGTVGFGVGEWKCSSLADYLFSMANEVR